MISLTLKRNLSLVSLHNVPSDMMHMKSSTVHIPSEETASQKSCTAGVVVAHFDTAVFCHTILCGMSGKRKGPKAGKKQGLLESGSCEGAFPRLRRRAPPTRAGDR
jgi:hypothetical protein